MGAEKTHENKKKDIHSSFNEIKKDISNVKQERINEVLGEKEIIKIDINIYNTVKSVCKIVTNSGIGTGFLIKLYKDNKDFFCLMTCEHVVTKEKINSKEKIIIYYDGQNERREIVLNSDKRYIREYSNKNLDIATIEILKADNINKKDFLLPYIGNYGELINQKIYIVQFPEGELGYCGGELIKIDNYEITHNVSTKSGSSGSPIFLENTTKVIGIHKCGNKFERENYGDFIYPIVEEDKKFIKKTINYYFMGIGYGEVLYYEGEMYDGKYGGKGKVVFLDGSKYIGEFKDGYPNGKGKLYKSKGKIVRILYDGDLVNGNFEGQGIKYYDNGDKYIGEFKNNCRNGKGKYESKERIIYEGDFVSDKPEGHGIWYYENGDKYIGEVKNGFATGKGIVYDKDDHILYDGDFVNNKSEGNGKGYYKNGNYYIGQWKNNLKHGKGIVYDKDDHIIYDGDFVNDKFEGNGKGYYKNGNYYIGQWKNNLRHGKGIEYDKNGNILYEGEFVNGKFKEH